MKWNNKIVTFELSELITVFSLVTRIQSERNFISLINKEWTKMNELQILVTTKTSTHTRAKSKSSVNFPLPRVAHLRIISDFYNLVHIGRNLRQPQPRWKRLHKSKNNGVKLNQIKSSDNLIYSTAQKI